MNALVHQLMATTYPADQTDAWRRVDALGRERGGRAFGADGHPMRDVLRIAQCVPLEVDWPVLVTPVPDVHPGAL